MLRRENIESAQLADEGLVASRRPLLWMGIFALVVVGVVVSVFSIDSFARALGVPLRPLPELLPGEPTRLRPALAACTAVLSGPRGAHGAGNCRCAGPHCQRQY